MADVDFPEKFKFLITEPWRYKVGYGGRGGIKSWSFSRGALIHGTGKTYFNRPLRILCAREIQKSIKESVHSLLKGQIKLLGLSNFYKVQETSITGSNGTEFLFAGLKHNINNIKSVEDVDIVWIEEAQSVSKDSWEILIPTIRKAGSEIWASWNPALETDDTYKRFILKPPPETIEGRPYAKIVKTGWQDNQWITDEMRHEKDELKAKDPDAYEHVWEGMCKQVVEGAIYKNELLAADKEGRICKVPYDALKPVHTFWDLGFGDSTSIWLAQSIGFEYRLIDYIEGSQQGLQHYLKLLQAKPYVWGTDYLPHDAKAHELGTGKTIEEQLRATGRRVQVVPKLSIMDGIAAARAVFPKCYFDAEKCADGLQALRHYQYEVDDKHSQSSEKPSYKREPLHNWASHPADAFRYFAVAIREPQRQREQVRQPMYGGESGWMS